MQPTQQIPQGLDPTAFILTKAIKAAETPNHPTPYSAVGDNGTSTGAYQIQNKNWSPWAKQYLGDANAPMTEENQNKLAYSRVKDLLSQGYTQSQVASIWNSGKPDAASVGAGTNQALGVNYDVPAYVNKVKQNYLQIQSQFGVAPQGDTQQQGAPEQAPSVGGFVQNAFTSTGNLVGNLAGAVIHPIDTVSNLVGTVAGAGEKLFGVDNADTQKFDNVVNYFKNRYGGDSLSQIVGNIGNTLYKDPAGAALDISTLLDGVGGVVGAVAKSGDVARAAELAKAADYISTAKGLIAGNTPEAIGALSVPSTGTRVAETIGNVADKINPITQGINAIKGMTNFASPAISTAGDVAASLGSHLTSLEPADMATIIKNPDFFSSAARDQATRGSVLDEVKNGLQTLKNSYSENGLAYNNIRNSSEVVKLPENFLSDILKTGAVGEDGKAIPFGLKLEPEVTKSGATKYKVVADSKSFTRSASDIRAVQNFVDNWAGKTELTPREFLNMRKDAAAIAKFGRDLGTNQDASLVGKAIRAQLNRTTRPQITGLQATDALVEPQINMIRKITKDLYNADGSLKDSAASKVANALNKDGLLARLETVSPGITKKLEVLKAVEGIEKAEGIKVASYGRNILEVGGLVSGQIPLVVAAIITHPAIATQILRGFGYTGAKVRPVMIALRAAIGALPADTINTLTRTGAINNISQQLAPSALGVTPAPKP